jgi:cytochrome oxidase assembly protein ShyY1
MFEVIIILAMAFICFVLGIWVGTKVEREECNRKIEFENAKQPVDISPSVQTNRPASPVRKY